MTATYYDQEGEFLKKDFLNFETGSSRFWVVDLPIQYRLPKRHGFVSVGATNLFDRKREKRRIVKFNDIPKVLVNAVISIEDKRFFQHAGFDPLRAVKTPEEIALGHPAESKPPAQRYEAAHVHRERWGG